MSLASRLFFNRSTMMAETVPVRRANTVIPPSIITSRTRRPPVVLGSAPMGSPAIIV
jgi:hypothetical protein